MLIYTSEYHEASVSRFLLLFITIYFCYANVNERGSFSKVGDQLNGRPGLRAAVWQHMSKSVTMGLAVVAYRLNANPF